MATFVIETYLSRARASEAEAETTRIRDAIAALTIDPAGSEPPARWLLSYFVPDDEMCVHLIEAPSMTVAARACERAGLTPERVAEATTTVNDVAAAVARGRPRAGALPAGPQRTVQRLGDALQLDRPDRPDGDE